MSRPSDPSAAVRQATVGGHLHKWLQTIRISWSQQMAYKTNLLLLVIGPMLVFFLIRASLWTAIFDTTGVQVIRGFTKAAMIRYQAWVLVVTLLAQGHTNMKISEDIRLGRISSYLVYPFQFWQFHAASFVAFQGVQTLIAAATVLALRLAGILPVLDASSLALGLGFAWLVSTAWFAVQFLLGLLSFWMDDTWVLRVMFVTTAQFLSGAMLPLEVFPGWLQRILAYSPFPYLTWAPVKIFLGEGAALLPRATLILTFWTLIFAGAASVAWRRGLKHYTGAGM